MSEDKNNIIKTQCQTDGGGDIKLEDSRSQNRQSKTEGVTDRVKSVSQTTCLDWGVSFFCSSDLITLLVSSYFTNRLIKTITKNFKTVIKF